VTTLVKCPLCGNKPEATLAGWLICPECRAWKCHTEEDWNRLGRLVRKGRMFVWLERETKKWASSYALAAGRCLGAAREWWRKRRFNVR